MKGILLIVFAYLLGSVPTGLLLAKGFAGVDPRERGSGNIGATNVLRTGGKVLGLLTLVGDMAKGAVPVALAEAWEGSSGIVLGSALAAFCGHLFPLYLRFRGGKGVATAVGIYLVLAPVALLLDVGVFVIGVGVSRMVSVGSLLAALAMPFLIPLLGYPPALLWAAVPMSCLIFLRHKGNIQRILRGQEHRILS